MFLTEHPSLRFSFVTSDVTCVTDRCRASLRLHLYLSATFFCFFFFSFSYIIFVLFFTFSMLEGRWNRLNKKMIFISSIRNGNKKGQIVQIYVKDNFHILPTWKIAIIVRLLEFYIVFFYYLILGERPAAMYSVGSTLERRPPIRLMMLVFIAMYLTSARQRLF